MQNFLLPYASKSLMKLLLLCLSCLSPMALLADESWPFSGVIRAVHEDEPILVVTHEGVRGFAEEAGELELRVARGDHQIAKPESPIKGTLVRKDGALALEAIWPAEPTAERSMMLINRDLTRPRIGAVRKGILKVGDELPRFALYNQLGKLVTPDQLENKAVVLNFIFTRSKVPSMSPATADRMAELQDKLVEAGLAESVSLVSVSLDPEFDTPGRCYQFLNQREIDHNGYWMLTGSKKTLDYHQPHLSIYIYTHH